MTFRDKIFLKRFLFYSLYLYLLQERVCLGELLLAEEEEGLGQDEQTPTVPRRHRTIVYAYNRLY